MTIEQLDNLNKMKVEIDLLEAISSMEKPETMLFHFDKSYAEAIRKNIRTEALKRLQGLERSFNNL